MTDPLKIAEQPKGEVERAIDTLRRIHGTAFPDNQSGCQTWSPTAAQLALDVIERALSPKPAEQPDTGEGVPEGVQKTASRLHRAVDLLAWTWRNRPAAIRGATEMWAELEAATADHRELLAVSPHPNTAGAAKPDDAVERAFHAGWSALADLREHIAHGDRSTLPDVPNTADEAWAAFIKPCQEQC